MQQRVASIPRLAAQPHLRPGHSFFPFYIAHCTRKLLLLLDPRRRGSVLPHDVLQPRALRLQPRAPRLQPAPVHPGCSPTYQVPLLDLLLSAEIDELNAYTRHAPLSRAAEEANWFTLPSAVRIYRQFLQLDTDHDGMLTPDELGRFDEEQHSLTPAFCNRLFEVVHTYEGRLDYKGYLDLVISLQALRPASAAPPAEAALRYFWRVLNLHDAPSLGSDELSFFARRLVGSGLLVAPQLTTLASWGGLSRPLAAPRHSGPLPMGGCSSMGGCGAAVKPGRRDRRRLRGVPRSGARRDGTAARGGGGAHLRAERPRRDRRPRQVRAAHGRVARRRAAAPGRAWQGEPARAARLRRGRRHRLDAG